MEISLEDERRWITTSSYWLMGLTPIIIIVLQFQAAPYGRYFSSSWGVLLPARHAWFIQELPSLLLPLGFALFTDAPKLIFSANSILICMFLLHYIQRALVFPFLIRSGKPTPLLPFVLAFVFCMVNGYNQGRFLTTFSNHSKHSHQETTFILGVVLFVAGMAINLHCDHILRNLRKPGETSYKIPHGGLFEYVSGANFFGEIVEWFGYAMACQSLPGWAFAVFTAGNLGPRAARHHKWYLEKFKEDYPQNRRALIPYVL